PNIPVFALLDCPASSRRSYFRQQKEFLFSGPRMGANSRSHLFWPKRAHSLALISKSCPILKDDAYIKPVLPMAWAAFSVHFRIRVKLGKEIKAEPLKRFGLKGVDRERLLEYADVCR